MLFKRRWNKEEGEPEAAHCDRDCILDELFLIILIGIKCRLAMRGYRESLQNSLESGPGVLLLDPGAVLSIE